MLPAALGREIFAGLPIRMQGPEDHQLLNVLDQQRRILKEKITAMVALLRSQTPPPPPDLRKLTDKVKDLHSIICDFAKQSRDLEAKCFILQREKEELDRLCEALRTEAETNAQRLKAQAKAAGCKCVCHCGAREVTGFDPANESLRKCREELDKLRQDFEAAAQHKKVLEDHNVRMAAELRVSEERFLSTRSFKRLMKQTQVLMDHVGRLKSENEELRKEREDAHDEVQTEVVKVRRQEESRRDDLERRFQDLTFRFEREVMSRQAVQAELEGIRKEQTAVVRLKETESLLAMRESELDSLKRRYKDQRAQREELEIRAEQDYQRLLDLQDALALREYQLAALQTPSVVEPEASTGEAGEIPAKLNQYREEIAKSREIIKKQDSEIASLKSREGHLRSKLNSEKMNYKKLIDDMECTNKGYDEAMKQNKQLLQQTKDHDQTVAKIISERISEDRSKHLLEEEAKECKKRADTQADVMAAQKTYIQKVEAAKTELELSVRTLQAKLKEAEVKLREVEVKCAGELRAHEAVEAAQRQSQEMCREYEKHLILTATDASQLKFHNSQLSSELLHLRSRLDSVQASPPSSDSVLTEELLKLRKMTRCAVCSVRIKELVLSKCLHAFCRRCVENRLGKERDCPVCRHSFTEMEVKEVWW